MLREFPIYLLTGELSKKKKKKREKIKHKSGIMSVARTNKEGKETTKGGAKRHRKALLTELAGIINTYEKSVAFLRSRKCLQSTPPLCPICNEDMTEIRFKRFVHDETIWRCSQHRSKKVSIRTKSFFLNSNLSLPNIISIIWCWAFAMPIHYVTEITGVSQSSVIQWNRNLRDICAWWLKENPQKLGGVGRIVQIDEYNLGHVSERWVFGGVDLTTGKGFLEMVQDRSQHTLLRIVEEKILPGTEIHSDSLSAYNGIGAIPVIPPYSHKIINQHSLVDPATGVHTNSIKCLWKNAKVKFKSMCGVQTSMAGSHLSEFIWHQYHGKDTDAFKNILHQISQRHPTQ